MTRNAWSLGLALFAGPLAVAAPAPPQRLATAEAVVVPLKGNPREVAAWLLSSPALTAAVQSQGRLGCLKGEKNPSAWLAHRLRASVDEGRKSVTIQLTDCPRPDAVALLTAVVGAYKGHALREEQWGLRSGDYEVIQIQAQPAGQAQVRLLVRANKNAKALGGLAVAEIYADVAENPLVKEAVDRSVTQPPRLIPTPVFGRASTPR